jgi:hypothetical protein
MGSFLTTGFTASRWANTDSAADLAAAINSLDSAITYVLFGGVKEDYLTLTKPMKFSDGLVEVLNDFTIGAGETVDDIVALIPLVPGANEAHELATVEAIRDFIVAYALDWGEDLYIPIIVDPVAGNFPRMTADGKLETSASNYTTWIPRITSAVAGNIPLMDSNGTLLTSAYSPASFEEDGVCIPKITSPVLDHLPLMQADGTLKTSAWAPDDFIPTIVTAVVNNFPVMAADGTLTTSGWGAFSFIKTVDPDPTAGNIPIFVDDDQLSDSGFAPSYFLNTSATAQTKTGALSLGGALTVGTDPSVKVRPTAGDIQFYDLVNEGYFKCKGESADDGPLWSLTEDWATPIRIWHEGNFKTGTMRYSDSTPTAAGATPVTQTLDTEDWGHGAADELFELETGTIHILAPGIYNLMVRITTAGAIQVGIKVTDGSDSQIFVAYPVSGDTSTMAVFTTIWYCAYDANLTIQAFHPAGSATPTQVQATISKVGEDGVYW